MKNNLRTATILSVGLLAVAFFFRQTILSGFEYIPGDVWDGQLLFGIVDHWRQFFSGQCAWNDLRIFWPMENTLAYSDTFFIEGVPYSILCALGVEQYIAYTLVFMAQAYVGYLSMYWLLKRFFNVRWGMAAAFAAIFVNLASMQLSIDSSHLQMTIVWFCPLFVAMCWKALEGGPRENLWAAGAAALLSAMFLSAYYMTWFMVFFLCIMVMLWFAAKLFITAEGEDSRTFSGKCRALASCMKNKRKAAASFAVTFAITIIPFLMLYVPAIDQFGKRNFRTVLNTLPRPIDFINVGERNYMWGWFGRMYGLDHKNYSGELNFGIPPVTLALFFVAFAFLLLLAFRKHKNANEDNIATIAGGAVLISWILLFRYNHDSAWYFVLKLVPGAGAMRSIFRMNLLLASASLIVIAVFMNRFAGRRKFAGAFASLILLILFLEQNAAPRTDNRIVRSVENAKMAIIPPPPADARLFFMVPDFKSGNTDMVIEHMTALLVAARYNLHTLNGHTGQLPYGWNLDITGGHYFRNAAQWLSSHGSPAGVYGLDAIHGKWLKPDLACEPLDYEMGVEIVDRNVFDKYAWAGWSGVESWGVWSDAHYSEFRFLIPDHSRDLVIKIEFHSFSPKEREQRVTMSVNGKRAGEWTLSGNKHIKDALHVSASEIKDGKLVVSFDLPDAISPNAIGSSADPRILGIGLDSFMIVPAE